MSSKGKVEILAPCGSLETLKMAVNCGADACYLGLNNFGARAFAPNFSHEEFIEAINYAHLCGVKVYVTLNTLYNEDELQNVMKEVKFLYENNVDALIIQDLGLLYLLSTNYPDLELHISTQMHIHNAQGVQFFKAFPNVKRVVLARETPLSIIAECQKLGIDIEIFAYGALCVSYSGQCLMSYYIHKRSGNKGMCSQNCRYRYDAIDRKTQKTLIHDEYLLSMKDLNIIDELPALLDLGIASIKIEGRMKRSEYVCQVVKTFRMAVDAYYEGRSFKLSNEQLKALKLLFNREFTKGLINGANKQALFNRKRPNHMGIYLGKVIGFNKKRVRIKLKESLNQHDGIRFIQKKDVGMNANYIYHNDLLVNHAQANDVIELEVKDYIEKDAYVVKTTDALLLQEINDYAQKIHRRIPIKMHYHAKISSPLVLDVICNDITITVKSTEICQKALRNPTSIERVKEQLSKINDSVYYLEQITAEHHDDIFISIKAINELRKTAICLLNTKRLDLCRPKSIPYKRQPLIKDPDTRCIVKVKNIQQYDAVLDHNVSIFSEETINGALLQDPIVNEQGKYPIVNDRIISEIGGLMLEGNKIAAPSLNVTNSYALEFLLQYCHKVILSLETKPDQVIKIKEAFFQRNGFEPNVYVMKYGKVELMHIKGDFIFENYNYEDIILTDDMGDMLSIYADHNNIKHLYTKEGIYFNADANTYINFIDENYQTCKEIIARLLD